MKKKYNAKAALTFNSKNKKKTLGLLALAILSLSLSGCWTSAKITNYNYDEQMKPIESCTAEYSSFSLGSYDGKNLEGCGAKGNATNANNSIDIDALKTFLQLMAK